MRWYVARTLPRSENRAQSALQADGFTTELPLIRRRQTRTYAPWRHGVRMVPMFPSYVFVAFDATIDDWPRIFRAPGVVRLFCARPTDDDAWVPIPLIDGAMDTIRTRAAASFIAEVLPNLAGLPVRIFDGPLAGLRGVCEWSSVERVQLIDALFDRVNVSRDIVEIESA